MERFLQDAGHCGRFQICHVTLVQLSRFVTAWALSLMVFGLYNPGWRCANIKNTPISSNYDYGKNTNLPSAAFWMNKSVNFTLPTYTPQYNNSAVGDSDTGQRYNQSSDDQRSAVKIPNITHATSSYSYSRKCDVINSCTFIEFNPASSTVVTEFDLVCDKVWIGYVIVSVLNGGMLTGALVWGHIGERFGRRAGLYGSNLVMAVSCALAVFSPVWEVYAVFTFFIGFAAIGVVNTVSTLSMEFLSSEWRARVGAIPVWNAGIAFFSVATYILRDWKHFHLASAVVCGIVCLGFFWTPESLRWLIIHGRTLEAEKTVDKITRLNKRSVPNSALKQLISQDVVNEANSQYTYLDLFRTYEIRVLTIKLGIVWVAAVNVYEIIGFGIQSLPGNFYTNLVLSSIVEFPGVLITGPLANKFGRRWTGIVFTSLGTLSCAIIVISALAVEKGILRDRLITSLAFITRSSMQAIMSFLIVYTAELMPTAVRSLSFGFIHNLVRITGLFGPYLLPRDFPSMVACFSVLTFLQILATVLFYSLAETKSRPLSDRIISATQTRQKSDPVLKIQSEEEEIEKDENTLITYS